MAPKKPIKQQIAAHAEGIPAWEKNTAIKQNESLFANTGHPSQFCFYHITTHTYSQDLITLQSCFLFIAGETSASHVTSDLPGHAL